MASLRRRTQIFTGWGHYPQQSGDAVRPEKYRELEAYPPACIARGQGRSYGDAALNDQRTLILTERLNRFLGFDRHTGVLTVESGVTLKEILDVVIPAGWFLPVTPGTAYASLGGCIAADVHGKNHHHAGSLGNYILAFELITASNKKFCCTPQQHVDYFWATIGGMGLTGVIGTVMLQLKRLPTSAMVVQTHTSKNLEQTFMLLQAADTQEYNVAWIDGLNSHHLGRGIVWSAHHALHSEVPTNYSPRSFVAKKLPLSIASPFLQLPLMKLFNRYYFYQHAHKKEVEITDCWRYFYPLDRLIGWNRLYGRRGLVQYQCVFPESTAFAATERLLHFLSQHGGKIYLAVLKRLGEASKGLLSFPMPGFTLALDMPFEGDDTLTLLQACHEQVIAAGGRVYLAKDVSLQPAQLQAMYPHYAQWLTIKQALDPENIFQSSLSRRLGILY